MLDLQWLRDRPEALDAALARRGLPPVAERLRALEADQRALHTRLQEQQARRNALSREIGHRRARGEQTDALIAEVAGLKDALAAGEDELRHLQAELEAELALLPNPPADEVPDGADESANVVLRTWGEPRRFAFEPRSHDELGARLGMHLAAAAKLSGARFVVLRDRLALLERALARLMLDIQTKEHGYVEVHVPYLVRSEALYGTGQLPKFADDQFRTTTDHWLIPTAEVPLTNLVAGDILDEAELPIRVTAYTPCFRAEAGAAGRDTRGMIRQHQFTKVELVSITTPEDSEAEHERMTACAEEVLKRLELPYRVVELCAGDLGFAARRTYDLEVWLPGQGLYREISSCSNCGDFQARRMNARYRPKGERRTTFVHTLNGSGLAVGRTLIAVLENCQQPDGAVTIPQALRPYMDGLDRLEPQD